MWILALLGIIGAAIGAVGNIVTTKFQNDANQFAIDSTNEANLQATRETNEANLQAVRETNASNVEQANLAYQRSLPINQVRDLMDAGMSRAGALTKLAGGGVYSPPALQASTAESAKNLPNHYDMSGLAQAFERLGNIPSSVQQMNMVNEQVNKMRQDAEFARNEEIRKQQAHDIAMDEKLYSKWQRESMDNFMSLMENTAQEKNIQPQPNQSMHEYVRALGLQDNEDYKKLPESARQRAFEHFKQAQEEHRAQVSFADVHDIAVKNKTILSNQIKEWNDAKDARDKENKARALEASLRSITAEMGLADKDFEKSLKYYLDDRGILKLGYIQQGSKHLQNDANAIWDAIFSVIPIKSLGKNLLEGLVHIGG